ncbi:hypothetical protein MPSEU_000601100 [Mayamaea pseudoterrestris]|nr:hypothetical protein MPSEU_000601100 [Mayamaea pseudoterrestris]
MVSIGTPEKLASLIEHLEIENGSQYLYVDPENILYDELDLNRGIQRTFFNVNTPFAFLDRFTRKDGVDDLKKVLCKWTKAFYIPPKNEQAFLQGGTFVIAGDKTVYAHYDPSTASHAPMDKVLSIARALVA